MYSLKELIENIFHLKMPLTVADLKEAKKIVVKMHPDKSGLDREYFLFYKRAFEMIVDFYKSENRQNQVITEDTTKYIPEGGENVGSVTTALGKMSAATFSKTFNKLFEENMAQKPDASRNQWFSETEAQYDIPSQTSAKNIEHVFETIKTTRLANQLVARADEVDTVESNIGTSLYEDDNGDTYISSDPFSKLKFEDLRKVHKDQTIFVVGTTTHNIPAQKTAEQFARERSQVALSPMEKAEAERVLAAKEAARQERLWAYHHNYNLRSLENEEKGKTVLSAFLQLRNVS
jgi:hypothetical protein